MCVLGRCAFHLSVCGAVRDRTALRHLFQFANQQADAVRLLLAQPGIKPPAQQSLDFLQPFRPDTDAAADMATLVAPFVKPSLVWRRGSKGEGGGGEDGEVACEGPPACACPTSPRRMRGATILGKAVSPPPAPPSLRPTVPPSCVRQLDALAASLEKAETSPKRSAALRAVPSVQEYAVEARFVYAARVGDMSAVVEYSGALRTRPRGGG